MKPLVPFALLAFLAVALPIGCENSVEGEGPPATGGAASTDKEGLRMCCELGALCHRAGEQEDAEMEACHDLGHENDPDACRANYERCLDLCAAGGAGGGAPHACL